METKEPIETLKNSIIGIDFGSSKITTYINDGNKINIVPDEMDYRSVKNKISFSESLDVVRNIGNSVSCAKEYYLRDSFKKTIDPTNKHSIKIYNSTYIVPEYFVRSMIMTQILINIKTIKTKLDNNDEHNMDYMISIPHNISPLKKALLESSINSIINIESNLTTSSVSYVLDAYALASHYADTHLEEHVVFHKESPNVNYDVLLVDMGHSKSSLIHINSKLCHDTGKVIFSIKKVIDSQFCGSDINKALLDFIIAKMDIKSNNGIINGMIIGKVKQKLEKIKKQLSSLNEITTIIELPDSDYQFKINQDEFMNYLKNHSNQCQYGAFLSDLFTFDRRISRMEFVGGNHRFGPIFENIKKTIKKGFHRQPKIFKTMDGDESTAKGCARIMSNTNTIINRKIKNAFFIGYMFSSNCICTKIYQINEYLPLINSKHIKVHKTNRVTIFSRDKSFSFDIHVDIDTQAFKNSTNLFIDVSMGMDDLPIINKIIDENKNVVAHTITFNGIIKRENKKLDECVSIEREIRQLESLLVRRNIIKNYLEEFHYKREKIKKKSRSLNKKNQNYTDLKDFQHFCRVFTDDPHHNQKKKLTRADIDNMLLDKRGIEKMDHAIKIINKILKL